MKLMIFFFFSIAAEQIYRVLRLWIYRDQKLRSTVEATIGFNNRSHTDTKRNAYISAPPSAKYDILVSVFNPRPDQQHVHWNVRTAMESKKVSIQKVNFNFNNILHDSNTILLPLFQHT